MLTDEKFNAARQEAKEFYNGVKEIRCPYLQQNVHFNSEGFEHLLTKSWNRGRSIKEQYGDGNKRKIFYSGNLEED